MVPAATTMAASSPGQKAERLGGGIGFAIRDGQLALAIKEEGSSTVMVATLHQSVVDEFCGTLADHLTEVSPEAADAQLGAESWPTMQ